MLKSFGSRTFYRGQTADEAVRAFQAVPGSPELVLIDDDLAFDEIPALYRACDVLVQPYRGEGFCLPALEALACGRPVIVTDGGSTDDFVPAECGWRVPSRRVPLPAGALPPGYELAGEGFLLEPDHEALVAALRAAADPAERSARAAHARAQAERFTWERAGREAAARIEALRDRRPIRSIAPTAVPDRRGFVFVVPADWAERETWAGPLRAYAEAFKAGDDTTLVLPTLDEAEALALASAELEAGGYDLERPRRHLHRRSQRHGHRGPRAGGRRHDLRERVPAHAGPARHPAGSRRAPRRRRAAVDSRRHQRGVLLLVGPPSSSPAGDDHCPRPGHGPARADSAGRGGARRRSAPCSWRGSCSPATRT